MPKECCEKLKKIADEKFEGNVSKAAEYAIDEYEREPRFTKTQKEIMKTAERGVDLGKWQYKSRSKIHERGKTKK